MTCTCTITDDGDGENGPHLSVECDEACPRHGRKADPASWANADWPADVAAPKGVGDPTGYGGHLMEGGF